MKKFICARCKKAIEFFESVWRIPQEDGRKIAVCSSCVTDQEKKDFPND